MVFRGSLALFVCLYWVVPAWGAQFTLSEYCPPGFEEVAGRCELRSLYQMYPSLVGAGVGGLKTGVPRYRESFTPQQIDLGRYLFFDPVLSGDGALSCASCHNPNMGFSDGRGQSLGAGQHVLPRSSPSLWNVAFQERFFWDARASSLEEQIVISNRMGLEVDSVYLREVKTDKVHRTSIRTLRGVPI